MDWGKYLSMLYESKKSTDIAADALKAINILGESGFPVAKSLMEWSDKKAYKLSAASGGGGSLEGNAISDILSGDWERKPTYTGIDDENEVSPNLLNIFLGREENVLPKSQNKPTSWTKGEPEQGWRSIKDWSRFKTWSPIDSEKEIGHEAVVKRKINEMRKSVAAGEYTPDMAVKRGEYGFKGIEYETDVDLGHASTSIGYDKEKKQYYYSITDVWDFEPKLYSEIWGGADNDSALRRRVYTQASLMQASGKSIGLYDRYYLPEDYMKNWFGELEKPSIEKKLISKFNKEDSEIF